MNQELLLRNEYRAAENRILRGQIKGRLLLSEGEKATLAEIAHRLGRMVLEEVAATAKPDTILGWYRKLIAKKFAGSKFRRRVGRPKVDQETERLVVRMARENPSWGYDRIVTRVGGGFACPRVVVRSYTFGEKPFSNVSRCRRAGAVEPAAAEKVAAARVPRATVGGTHEAG